MRSWLDTTYEELKFLRLLRHVSYSLWLDTTYEELKYMELYRNGDNVERLDTTYEELKSKYSQTGVKMSTD